MSDTPEIVEEKKEETSPEDDVIEVSLVRQEKQVNLKMPDGTINKCTMKEMVGAERDKWLNFAQKRTLTQNGQPVGMSEYKGMQARLISMCLYDEDGKLIPEEVIDKWNVTAKDSLFKLAQRMNALDNVGIEQAKNS